MKANKGMYMDINFSWNNCGNKTQKTDLSRESDASGSLTGDCIENIMFAWVKINLKLKMNLNMNMSMNLNLNLNLNNICLGEQLFNHFDAQK